VVDADDLEHVQPPPPDAGHAHDAGSSPRAQ
jgi:hypothetical protein